MNKTDINSKLISRLTRTVFLFYILLLVSACEDKNADTGFKADFSFGYTSENLVHFENKSEGEYYSLQWDFGNGTTETTTDKRKTFDIFYPLAGDYSVSLKVLDFTGNTKTTTKTITITQDDLIVSFTTTIEPAKPNYVKLKNTTVGEYDSFSWIFGDKEIKNAMDTIAYFPFSGSFEIKLEVYKASDTVTIKKTVNITQDDPDYIQNMTLTWSDEFDGSAVNTSNWVFETGAGGWGNAELQNYTAGDNAQVINGKLIITARKVNDNKVPGSYTSTRLSSKTKREFTYGRIEIRAKLPSGTGIWPAIWMLGSNFSSAGWPACGEIDIMEYVGYQPNTIHATVHTPSGYGGAGSGSSKTLTTCEEEFHIYGLIWTENELTFYTDTPANVTHIYAPATKTASTWPFDKHQFFILNVAVGGTWGGAQGIDNDIFPQSMEIDYVRVYQ